MLRRNFKTVQRINRYLLHQCSLSKHHSRSRDSLPDSIWKKERVSVLALSVHPDRFETFLNDASSSFVLTWSFLNVNDQSWLFVLLLFVNYFARTFLCWFISNFFLFTATRLKNTIINPSKINIRFLIGNWRKSRSGENESERHLAATFKESLYVRMYVSM